ncbi:MAG: MOSC domain-containing protein [Paracoccaceae bacterium]
MTATLTEIRRHPVKALGAETLARAELREGKPIAFDRRWAIAHSGAGSPDADGWMAPRNFVTQKHVPALAAVTAAFEEATGQLALAHPDRPPLTVRPDAPDDARALTDWIGPLADAVRPGPYRLLTRADGAMTDDPDAGIHIGSTATLRAVSEAAGHPLSRARFRANLWVDGWAPYEEFDLVGRRVRIGGALLEIIERTGRCAATMANPSTGRRDIDLPAVIQRYWGHTDFGVYARVVEGDTLAPGDPVSVA